MPFPSVEIRHYLYWQTAMCEVAVRVGVSALGQAVVGPDRSINPTVQVGCDPEESLQGVRRDERVASP